MFSKSAFAAQYHGVQEAASRVHDEHIGIGRVYHLFRLPEHVEQALFNSLQNKVCVDSIRDQLQNQERALDNLITLADSLPDRAEGPVLIGDIDELMDGKNLGLLAHYYLLAFKGNTKTYPYYLDKK